jgi:hypothetical protein
LIPQLLAVMDYTRGSVGSLFHGHFLSSNVALDLIKLLVVSERKVIPERPVGLDR